MTTVYGRIKDKRTDAPVTCEVVLEPESLGHIYYEVLYMFPAYLLVLDDDGDFIVDVAPGKYILCMEDTRLHVEVPDVKEVSLKDLVAAKYKNP